MFRIAHLSDLHFSKISKNPLQFFSKRLIGNVNLLLFRKKKWAKRHIESLGNLLHDLSIHLVIITGDLTSTSHRSEFRAAQAFLKELQHFGMKVIVVPGNHDHYTKKAYRERHFYSFFPTPLCEEEHHLSHFDLKTHAVGMTRITPGWWLVAIDTALATSLTSSRGYFSKEIEAHVKRALEQIPQDQNVIIANHFPFFQHDLPRKNLVRGEALKELLKGFPNVKLFLHGHTHRRCVADLRSHRLPIIVDCGSTGIGAKVSWNLINLNVSSLSVQHFISDNEHWEKGLEESFSL